MTFRLGGQEKGATDQGYEALAHYVKGGRRRRGPSTPRVELPRRWEREENLGGAKNTIHLDEGNSGRVGGRKPLVNARLTWEFPFPCHLPSLPPSPISALLTA